MSQVPGLSLDQAPPLGVPLRFFLTAPLFALAAALLMLWQGADLFSDRWHPAMLGITHILTLGYMGLVMLGAVLQMLPVVAGTPVRRPRLVAVIMHALVTIGVILLGLGLMFTVPLALQIALPLLGGALLSFAGLVVVTLRRALPYNMTARALRLAALMLAATVLLGMALLSNHAFGWWLQARQSLTDLHLAWGLLGWAGILVVGVSWQVVPMFLLTRPYPVQLTRWLAPLLFGALLTLAVASGPARTAVEALLAAGLLCFALVTLWLQRERRRKLPDVSLNFWRIGLASLLAAIVLWSAAQLSPALRDQPGVDIALGVLAIVGFAMSIINGMLYKIVPFLVWFHLQSRRGHSAIKAPNVREVLPEARARPQLWLHLAALAALLLAIVWPLWVYPAAALFAASNLWLWLNIVEASRLYRRVGAQFMQANAGGERKL